MSSQIEFQVMFDKLLSHLKSSNKVVEISSHFGPNKNLQDMFMFIWELEDIHQYLHISSGTTNKSDLISENFRKEGNKFYKKKAIVKALECYNNSIIHAPQCGSEYKNLSFGYANRSAVLYEMKNYEKSLEDISRSINNGYPSLLKSKLIERQAKCYLLLNHKSKARETLKEGLHSLATITLEKEKCFQIKQTLESLLMKCNLNEETSYSDETETKQFTMLFNDAPKAPELHETNEQIHSLNSAVDLSYSSEKGRFLIANRDIMPGEIIIKENGYSSITLPSSLKSHCSKCHQRTFVPIPCTSCSSVIFCSEECHLQGLQEFHYSECPILSLLLGLDLGKNPMLALRMVIQNPLEELKLKVQKYRSEEDTDYLHFGFNENKEYTSKDYRTMYHLVTNKNKRGVSDLFKRGVIAVALVKLLLKTEYFGKRLDNLNEVDEDLLNDIKFVGEILFTHLMNLPCNAHSLTELQLNPFEYQKSHVEDIGAGAFAVLSLTNHSCDPSLARSCYGNTVISKSIKYIFKGDEITDSYGEHYAINFKEERQKCLQQQYYFLCSCEACISNWSLYSSLHETLFIKCPNCLGSIGLNEIKCIKCGKYTSALKFSDDNYLVDLIPNIENASKAYNLSYKNILSGSVSKVDGEVIIKFIFYLCKYAILPNKILFEAQETLKHCFDRQGSCYNIFNLNFI